MFNFEQENLTKLNLFLQDPVGKIAQSDNDKDFKYMKLKKKVKVACFKQKLKLDTMAFKLGNRNIFKTINNK